MLFCFLFFAVFVSLKVRLDFEVSILCQRFTLWFLPNGLMQILLVFWHFLGHGFSLLPG